MTSNELYEKGFHDGRWSDPPTYPDDLIYLLGYEAGQARALELQTNWETRDRIEDEYC